jgi:hypothetical protein
MLFVPLSLMGERNREDSSDEVTDECKCRNDGGEEETGGDSKVSWILRLKKTSSAHTTDVNPPDQSGERPQKQW